MKLKTLALLIGLSTGATLLTACGGSTSSATDPLSSITTLQGSVFKGPIDAAQIQLMDGQGNVISDVQSSNGTFTMPGLNTLPDVIFIKSSGGSYTDEATSQTANLNLQQGLQAVFSKAELMAILANNEFITLTPETTLLAELARSKMAAGSTPQQAIDDAKTLIEAQLLQGTEPTGIMANSDTILRTGNLTTALPANNSEALARNRAISFSYETRNLGLSPEQVFELIQKRAEDLKDGSLDGVAQGTPLAITPTDTQNSVVALDQEDQRTNYGQARGQLLQSTIGRLSSGNLSAAEQEQLASQMGIDPAVLQQNQQQTQQQNQDAVQTTQVLLAATTLPAFKHLPVMTDEDGVANDGKATYTFTASNNVNVTIDTPNGSWVTPMMRYNNSALPPLIRAQRGDVMTLTLNNNLAEESTIHWHGFKIPAIQDGNPDIPILTGGSHQYDFTIDQPAASLWFHPHPHKRTAHQVYYGLAGAFIIEDAISLGLETNKELPSGAFDIPLMVQDRRFAADNGTGQRDLLYMDKPQDQAGMYGDVVLVNGVELPKFEVATRQYRFRLYNVSNARSYEFALSNGARFMQIATDGGLLPAPVSMTSLTLGAAERAEIVIDFSSFTVGDKVMLISKPFSNGMMGAMGGGMGGGNQGGGIQNGAALDIMRFDIARQEVDDITLYAQLPANAEINTRIDPATISTTRSFVMSMMGGQGGGMGNQGGTGNQGGMSFTINGKSFDMTRIDEYVTANASEIWEIRNMSPMAHPFHAHAIQWQILDRNGVAASGADLGWKDTVLVQPGQTVRFIGQFEPVNVGDYMYHCHILEHEDAGMMGMFKVLAPGETVPVGESAINNGGTQGGMGNMGGGMPNQAGGAQGGMGGMGNMGNQGGGMGGM
ncbi:MAG: multicopper oxidase family protein [Gammaproteobacteria bacterium]|nr:multicopper oxidase family protein [Gammaproteobacteria bacterium]